MDHNDIRTKILWFTEYIIKSTTSQRLIDWLVVLFINRLAYFVFTAYQIFVGYLMLKHLGL